MAVVTSGSVTEAPSNSDLTKVSSDFKCICCQHIQQESGTVLLELKTAAKNDTITSRRYKICCTEHDCSHTR